MVKKEYSVTEYTCACYLALGWENREIRQKVEISDHSLNLLQQDPIFRSLVEKKREDLQLYLLKESPSSIDLEIRMFRAENRVVTDEILTTGKAALNITRRALERLKPHELSDTSIPTYAKMAIQMFESWERSKSKSLQLDKLMELKTEFAQILEEHEEERKALRKDAIFSTDGVIVED